MYIYYLITLMFVGNGDVVPVVQGRTMDLQECKHYAALYERKGVDAFCAVEQLETREEAM